MAEEKYTSSNKRIAKNTMLLYFRMILIMLVTLYTSRVVLNALGVEDFGIFNVVGGVVVMFSVLSGSLSAAISRFITYELGQRNVKKLKAIFSTSVSIQLFLALMIFFLAETVGLWFVYTYLNIPEPRMSAAIWVYHFSILTFCVNLLSAPYNALIISYEKMNIYAYFSILEVILKLAVVLLLVKCSVDRLKLYSILLFFIALIIRFLYGYYCRWKYPESRFKFTWDRELFKEMLSFAGWNFIGSSSSVFSNQGINILLNIFCGPLVNASRGIAYQVSSAITTFSNSFMTAVNPQITKSYASGDKGGMLDLIFLGSRISFALLLLISLPLLFETNFILKLWLNIVPNYSVVFVQLVLILALSESFSAPLITAMLATGKIRNYQIVVGGTQMLNLPVSYVLLRIGLEPTSVFITMISVSQLCLFLRLYMLKDLIGISMSLFIKKVYLPSVLTFAFSSCLLYMTSFIIITEESLFRLIFTGVISITITAPLILYLIFSKRERVKLLKAVKI